MIHADDDLAAIQAYAVYQPFGKPHMKDRGGARDRSKPDYICIMKEVPAVKGASLQLRTFVALIK